MKSNPEQEFIEFMTVASKTNGLDELSSRIIAILFIEPGPICLEELTKKTGYSMSAVSTVMKFLENFPWISRMKKPGSRKVFFSMDTDLLSMMQATLQTKFNVIIIPAKTKLPRIIKDYKKEISKTNNSKDKEKLKIIENYHKQVLAMESVMADLIKRIEKIK